MQVKSEALKLAVGCIVGLFVLLGVIAPMAENAIKHQDQVMQEEWR